MSECGMIPTSKLIKNTVYPNWYLSYYFENLHSDAWQRTKIFYDRFLEHCLNVLWKRLIILRYIIYLVGKLR